MMCKTTDLQDLKLKMEEIVSLTLLHNSNLLQIPISGMSAVETSLTLSSLYQTQYASWGKSETIVKMSSVSCAIRFLVLVFSETVFYGRNCAPNIDAKSFSLRFW